MRVDCRYGRNRLYRGWFVIGAMVSAAAVAYYAMPFEVVTKLFVISGAISGLMFPAFSLTGARNGVPAVCSDSGSGSPDLPAKLNLLEIPFYAAALYWLIETFGATGAGVAWIGRAVVDAAMQFCFAHRLQRAPTANLARVPMVSAAFIDL